MGYAIGLMGMWIFGDAVFSITLYLNSDSYDGKKQTWKKDHWVRAVRGICGIILMYLGAFN